MYIQQLVIEGFKSYKDRVCIQFHPGLNVVIGKNGAGKSNVFAAIEFVLSNKYNSLRAEDRQRLLHEGSGSSSSQQLAAEVEITFNNEDRRFPEDKDIVTLKRVIGLKKDEFLLNNRHVSKSQVDNLLESAGFSRSNPYNIVQQGKVNALLKTTDATRLDLLKEVAGTRVYDKRRAESLKIMHTTDTCRAQITEISESLERRLQELENEQEELRQFQELDKERRSLEFTVFTLEQNSADRKLSSLEEERGRAHLNAEEAHKAAEAIQERQSAVDAELSELKVGLTTLTSQKKEITLRLNKVTKKCAHQAMVVRGDQEAALQGKAEADKLKAGISALEMKISKSEKKLELLSSKYAAEKAKEQAIENELSKCQARMEELFSKQGRKSQFKSKDERDRYLEKEIAHSAELVAQDNQQISSTKAIIAEKENRLHSLNKNCDQFSSEIENDAQQLHQLGEKLTELKEVRDRLTNERKECWRLDAQHESKTSQLKAKLQAAESKLYSCMPRDVRVGLQTIKELCAQQKITGVYGMLCELFTTEPAFYQAVQTTAGNRLYHVVVDTDQTASKIIEAMRRARAGRVTFMPLNRLKQDCQSMYVESADAIAMMDKLVFKPMFRPAMSQVFGKTVIARNLDVGSVYSREHGMNAITLDGDQVNKKGAIVGGFVDSRSSALKNIAELVNVRSEIESAPDVEGLRKEATAKDQEVTIVLGDMHKLESQKRFLRERIHSRKDELNAMVSEIKIITADIASKKQALESYQLDIAQVSARIEAYQRELQSDFSSSLTPAEQAELESLQTVSADLESQLLKQSKQRSSAQTELSALTDLLNLNYRAQLKDLQDSLSSAAIEDDDASDHLAELKALQSSEESLKAESDQLQEEIDDIQSKIQLLTSELDTLKEREASNASELATHSRRMEKIVNRRSLLLQKKDDCIRNIRQLGALPSGAFEKFGEKSINDLMALLKTCNGKLKKYNHVNRKAIDQFLNFTEQRARLKERKIELDRGKKAIEDCISHLDHQKDEAIRRTFKSIAKNFSKVFSELVPGGKATLIIQTSKKSQKDSVPEDSDDDDAEPKRDEFRNSEENTTDRYCGIGIKVSFSGEGNVFSMAQLSGGQQTVVALCLIFGIQRCDPFPFYLFDEIDSALDSAHRSSIAQMIGKRSRAERNEELDDDIASMRDEDEDEGDKAVSKIRKDESRQTQFICTTFRPEMLEYADRCFGVYYTNKVSQVQEIDVDAARSILDSNEHDVRDKE